MGRSAQFYNNQSGEPCDRHICNKTYVSCSMSKTNTLATLIIALFSVVTFQNYGVFMGFQLPSKASLHHPWRSTERIHLMCQLCPHLAPRFDNHHQIGDPRPTRSPRVTRIEAMWKHHFILVGGWPTPLTKKIVSWDDEIPNIWKK